MNVLTETPVDINSLYKKKEMVKLRKTLKEKMKDIGATKVYFKAEPSRLNSTSRFFVVSWYYEKNYKDFSVLEYEKDMIHTNLMHIPNEFVLLLTDYYMEMAHLLEVKVITFQWNPANNSLAKDIVSTYSFSYAGENAHYIQGNMFGIVQGNEAYYKELTEGYLADLEKVMQVLDNSFKLMSNKDATMEHTIKKSFDKINVNGCYYGMRFQLNITLHPFLIKVNEINYGLTNDTKEAFFITLETILKDIQQEAEEEAARKPPQKYFREMLIKAGIHAETDDLYEQIFRKVAEEYGTKRIEEDAYNRVITKNVLATIRRKPVYAVRIYSKWYVINTKTEEVIISETPKIAMDNFINWTDSEVKEIYLDELKENRRIAKDIEQVHEWFTF